MQTSENSRITQIDRNHPNYPSRLLDLSDPPSSLYIYGDIQLLNLPMLAIVGSRTATPEGIKSAHYFARALSEEGYLIVSGLARGIDGAAHKGALGPKLNQPTLAVCGTGLDISYPPEHLGLTQAIGHHGLLVSELAPGVGPKAWHFPRRNRIIAALSLGILVVEAAERSGVPFPRAPRPVRAKKTPAQELERVSTLLAEGKVDEAKALLADVNTVLTQGPG